MGAARHAAKSSGKVLGMGCQKDKVSFEWLRSVGNLFLDQIRNLAIQDMALDISFEQNVRHFKWIVVTFTTSKAHGSSSVYGSGIPGMIDVLGDECNSR